MEFLCKTKGGFFSLLEDKTFVRNTSFIVDDFVVYDGFLRCFCEVAPVTFFQHPSPFHPYLVVKPKDLPGRECPGLEERIQEIKAYTEETLDYPHFNLFPASARDRPTYSDKAIQTADNIRAAKRKASAAGLSFEVPTGSKAPKITVKFQVTVGDDNKAQVDEGSNASDGGPREAAQGSGMKANPIVVHD